MTKCFMQPAPHVLLGFLIGFYVSPLWLVILLSIASHFLLDAIPHWDPQFDTETKGINLRNWKKQPVLVRKQIIWISGIQVVLLIALGISLNKELVFTKMFIGGIVSLLPDYYEWIAGIFGWPSVHIYNKLLKHRHTGWKKGAIIQIITSATSLFPILKIFLRASGK